MNAEISLVIADDHPLFRKGVRQTIEEDPSLKILGEAGDGAAALRLIEDHRPDVAVLDIDMPHLRGLQIAKAVRERGLDVAVILLTMYGEDDMVSEALDDGVKGYVLKEMAVIDLLEAIRTVARGDYYYSPAIAGGLARRSQRMREFLSREPGIALLTPSERRIMKLISLNKTSKEIAEDLCISYRTVETHRSNIAAKLELRGSHSLLKFAMQHRAEF